MLNRFLTFVNEKRLPLADTPTLLAVSGGVDSMVMAELFHRAGFPFALAHCNFNLRGGESDEDERFVRQWATDRGVPIHVRGFATRAKADRERISIQMAARDLRYAWFKELRTSFDYASVATAHHADDAIETVLLNLARGTGLPGLLGIAPARNGLLRPLLFAAKKEILHFARREGIAWREDSSNLTDSYRRNLVRHQVLPVLQAINPSLETTFRHTHERLRAASTLLDRYLDAWMEKSIRRENHTLYISIQAVREAAEPAYQLHAILEPLGYTYVQSLAIVSALDTTSGRKFLSASHELIKDRTELLVRSHTDAAPAGIILILEGTKRVALPDNQVLELTHCPHSPAFIPSADPARAYFDSAKLQFPLSVRPWQPGDWFCPFGMGGKRKKVSDLLIDRKVPLSHKRGRLVLLNGDQRILWVIGMRADERFRLGPHTLGRTQITYITS